MRAENLAILAVDPVREKSPWATEAVSQRTAFSNGVDSLAVPR